MLATCKPTAFIERLRIDKPFRPVYAYSHQKLSCCTPDANLVTQLVLVCVNGVYIRKNKIDANFSNGAVFSRSSTDKAVIKLLGRPTPNLNIKQSVSSKK